MSKIHDIKKYILITTIIVPFCILFVVVNDRLNHSQIKDIGENFLSEKISKEEIDNLIKQLKKQNKQSEISFIEGAILKKENKLKEAKIKFNEVLQSKNINSSYLMEVYTYVFLAEIAQQEKDYENLNKFTKNAFYNINPKYYDENIDIIKKIIKLLNTTQSSRKVAIDILNKLIKSNKISNDFRLYALDRLGLLYFMNNQYSNSSEINLNYILLANDIGKQKEYAKSIVDLATIFKQLKGNETAIVAIQKALDVKIDDKVERGKFKPYAYLNLAEIYVCVNKYEDALKSVNEIQKYKGYYNEEDYRDFKILANVIKIRCYINIDKKKEAAKLIEETEKLLKEDKSWYFIDKELEFSIAKAQYYKSIGYYDSSIEEYLKALEYSKKEGNYYKEVIIIEELIDIYKATDDSENFYKYTLQLIDLKEYMEGLRYEDYSKYIIQSTTDKKKLLDEYEFKVKAYKIVFIVSIAFSIIYYLLYKRIKNIKKLSQRDGLTNIYNRRQFNKVYKKLIYSNKKFSCIILDIDHFKSINDIHGHKTGDEVIIGVCNEIKKNLDSDCSFYRYGGEEFVIIIKNKEKKDVISLAEKVRIKVQDLTWNQGINVTISLGIAFKIDSTNNIIEIADKNLYKAKESGRNKVAY